MPIRNQQVKQETTLDKIRRKLGCLKSTELSVRGRTKDIENASQVLFPSDSRRGCDTHTSFGSAYSNKPTIPVIGKDRQPLMPTTPSRARRWIKSGRATPFWVNGIFCVRLNETVQTNKQIVVVGIDPGSKREAFTVKSKAHTYLNVLSDAVTWVKDSIQTRREMRRGRRFRKTPCRKNRYNRSKGGLAPSTKARWQSKLRIVNILRKMFPITDYVVEDINTTTKKGKKWNLLFSPLQVGKTWFYSQLSNIGGLTLKQGFETAQMRENLGLKKFSNKMDERFSTHNVDSWVLAHSISGGISIPDNTVLIRLSPIQFHRRQLHRFQPTNGKRSLYGGTISMGFKRGALVRHPKYKICYVGGTLGNRISLHNLKDGSRLCQNAKPSDIKFLAYNYWRAFLPEAKKAIGVSCSQKL